ncbi:MAG: hypothetical protein U0795_11445 [Pirellulales bacterium]
MRTLAKLLMMAAMLSAGCNDPSGAVSHMKITNTSEIRSEQTAEPNDVQETDGSTSSIPSVPISAGTTLKTALTILDNAGYTKETEWQWGSFDPDSRYICRVITDGIFMVLYYSEKTQVLTGVAMMYVPPDYTHRGNYQVVSVDSVAFNVDGAYTVAFPKPKSTAGK